jgi:hypothetical protein
VSGLPERIGKAINELDIDFSRFTVVGWAISIASLATGFLIAWSAYWAVAGKVADDRGPALAFGLSMIGTTVLVFLSLRAVLGRCGVSIVKERRLDDEH